MRKLTLLLIFLSTIALRIFSENPTSAYIVFKKGENGNLLVRCISSNKSIQINTGSSIETKPVNATLNLQKNSLEINEGKTVIESIVLEKPTESTNENVLPYTIQNKFQSTNTSNETEYESNENSIVIESIVLEKQLSDPIKLYTGTQFDCKEGDIIKIYALNNSGVRTLLFEKTESEIQNLVLPIDTEGEIQVEVENQSESCELSLPNIFTPNGDQLNDQFGITCNCKITDFQIKIYDLKGNQVFISESPDHKWDGNNCEGGNYFWILTYQDSNNKIHLERGDILMVKP